MARAAAAGCGGGGDDVDDDDAAADDDNQVPMEGDVVSVPRTHSCAQEGAICGCCKDYTHSLSFRGYRSGCVSGGKLSLRTFSPFS